MEYTNIVLHLMVFQAIADCHVTVLMRGVLADIKAFERDIVAEREQQIAADIERARLTRAKANAAIVEKARVHLEGCWNAPEYVG